MKEFWCTVVCHDQTDRPCQACPTLPHASHNQGSTSGRVAMPIDKCGVEPESCKVALPTAMTSQQYPNRTLGSSCNRPRLTRVLLPAENSNTNNTYPRHLVRIYWRYLVEEVISRELWVAYFSGQHGQLQELKLDRLLLGHGCVAHFSQLALLLAASREEDIAAHPATSFGVDQPAIFGVLASVASSLSPRIFSTSFWIYSASNSSTSIK